jgi:hypothetical protein
LPISGNLISRVGRRQLDKCSSNALGRSCSQDSSVSSVCVSASPRRFQLGRGLGIHLPFLPEGLPRILSLSSSASLEIDRSRLREVDGPAGYGSAVCAVAREPGSSPCSSTSENHSTGCRQS